MVSTWDARLQIYFVAFVFYLYLSICMRTSIYIDGFNFYYGAVKDSPYKRLNFKSLFSSLLNDKYQIVEIKYFTALVSGLRDPRQPIRQKTFLRALEAYIPEISIYYGHFLSHKVNMPLAEPSKKRKFERVIKSEEKGSDGVARITALTTSTRCDVALHCGKRLFVRDECSLRGASARCVLKIQCASTTG